MFNIITLNNWTTVLINANSVHEDLSLWPIATSAIFISWIIIGNYVLLNLFLAILLDGFDENTI